jgi:hypothetical protein
VAGDFDADGDTDIALVGGAGWNTIPIAFSNRDGTFTVTNLTSPDIPQWAQASGAYAVGGDFDRDGDTDIALLGGSGWTTVPIAFSSRNGRFTRTNTAVSQFPALSRAPGAQAVVADFDGDGDADIALGAGQKSTGEPWSTIPVAFSNRTGGFTFSNRTVPRFTEAAQFLRLLAGDFDGDGDGDIAGVGLNNKVYFALSDRTGSFVPAHIPIGNFPERSVSARFALTGKFDWGSRADIMLLGGSGWTSIHGVLLRAPFTP